jgi:hypothetical protein
MDELIAGKQRNTMFHVQCGHGVLQPPKRPNRSSIYDVKVNRPARERTGKRVLLLRKTDTCLNPSRTLEKEATDEQDY